MGTGILAPLDVSPHRSNWITELSENKRACKLLGHTCVADFDITIAALAPLAWEIMEKLAAPEEALADGLCDAVNIGLYDGGRDIRVWKVRSG